MVLPGGQPVAGTPLPTDESLKADVAAARLSGGKPLNPNAPPLEYVEKGGAVVQRGQSGPSVSALQDMLNRAGASPKLSASGTYDANTEAAVKALQQKHKLPDDGRVGADTLSRIRTEDAKASLPASLDPSVKKEIAARLDFDPKDAATREAYVALAKSRGFDSLGVAQQKQVIGILDVAPKDAALAGDLKTLVATDSFRSLSPSIQKLALEKLEVHATDPAARSTLTRLSTSWGFNKLDAHQQSVFLNQMGGDDALISAPARKALDAKLTALENKRADEQQAGLSTFLKDQPWPDWATRKGAWDQRTTPPDSVKGPAEVAKGPFTTAKGAADRYDVSWGSQQIPVFVPRGTPPEKVKSLIDTMGALPAPNRAVITELVMEPKDLPAKAGYAPAGFDANGDTGRVRAFPEGLNKYQPDSRMSAMVHESAHIVDRKMKGVDPNWDAKWAAAKEADIAKPSQRAKDSDAEDFAEAYLLYKLHQDDPKKLDMYRAMFPARFKLIEEVEAHAQSGALKK